jgi:hypothetical protein
METEGSSPCLQVLTSEPYSDPDYFLLIHGWGETESTWYTGLFYQPRMVMDESGAVRGMKIGRGNLTTRRKPAPGPLSPPQILHELTWDRTRGSAVGSWRLTS